MNSMDFYIKLKQFSLLYSYFAYIDVPDYLADQLFVKHRVYVFYDNEYAHPEHGYRVILCHVARWRRRAFIAALNELPTLMAMAGKGDYMGFCGDMVQSMREKYETKHKKG